MKPDQRTAEPPQGAPKNRLALPLYITTLITAPSTIPAMVWGGVFDAPFTGMAYVRAGNAATCLGAGAMLMANITAGARNRTSRHLKKREG